MEDQQQIKREVALTNSSENPTNSDASVVTNNGNIGDESLEHNNDAYFDSFPSGYRFKPLDEELVVHYLNRRVLNEPLPPNKIKEVELYKFNPEALAEKFPSPGAKEWYFFTPRERKYRNGERPNRAAGDGYWKATGADKAIKSNGVKVGFRKALVFYKGKAPKGDKSDWIMHEYRVNNPPKPRRTGDGMRLDDWVLCRIYKKLDKSIKTPTRSKEHATQFQQAENGIPTQHQNNGCMSVDNSALVRKEALMQKVFDMKSNYNHESRMGYFNGYGNVTSYQSSFPRVPHSYDPSLDQNYVFAHHIIPDYENPIGMVEPLSSKLPLHSMETHMKLERFNEYHQDEPLSFPALENYDLTSNIDNFDHFVNMDNSLSSNPMMMAPFDGDNQRL